MVLNNIRIGMTVDTTNIRKQNYKQDTITKKALRILPSYRIFKETYNFLQKSQWWTREQLEEYQLEQLNNILDHAYTNVPYYRKVFNERGLKPKDIQDFKDLQKLSFLTKDLIRDNLKDLKARNYPHKKFEYVTTGGSTGVPLGFYYEKAVSRAKEWAFMKTQWDRVGYNFRDKCAVLKGYVVNSVTDYRFWEPSFFGRWLVFSSYHMTDENLPIYIKKIRQFKPKFIQAFPSIITILAGYMKKHNILPFDSVKAILCGSENMYPGQRELIEDAFQCKLYTWYGHAERVVLGGECEKSKSYHLFPEYGITELIGENEKPVRGEREVGMIVGTGFTNYCMPLIRYKTDDLGVHTNKKCDCHREYPLLKNVEGRWLQEFIITKNDRLISITALNMHSDVFDNVKQFQFYQDKKGEVFLNIVRGENYTTADTEYIKRELCKKMDDDVQLIIQFVNNIPRTIGGKYRFLIQKLPIEFGDYKYEL